MKMKRRMSFAILTIITMSLLFLNSVALGVEEVPFYVECYRTTSHRVAIDGIPDGMLYPFSMFEKPFNNDRNAHFTYSGPVEMISVAYSAVSDSESIYFSMCVDVDSNIGDITLDAGQSSAQIILSPFSEDGQSVVATLGEGKKDSKIINGSVNENSDILMAVGVSSYADLCFEFGFPFEILPFLSGKENELMRAVINIHLVWSDGKITDIMAGGLKSSGDSIVGIPFIIAPEYTEVKLPDSGEESADSFKSTDSQNDESTPINQDLPNEENLPATNVNSVESSAVESSAGEPRQDIQTGVESMDTESLGYLEGGNTESSTSASSFDELAASKDSTISIVIWVVLCAVGLAVLVLVVILALIKHNRRDGK